MKMAVDTTARGAIRIVLLLMRAIAFISSVIVLGITAWGVEKVESYRVVYPLVIAVLSTAYLIPAMVVSSLKRNRGYFLPLDIIFSYLWLAAFVFLSQHVKGAHCRWFRFGLSAVCSRKNTAEAFSFLAFFWIAGCMCLEIFNVYFAGKDNAAPDPHLEKRLHSDAPMNPPQNNGQPTAEPAVQSSV